MFIKHCGQIVYYPAKISINYVIILVELCVCVRVLFCACQYVPSTEGQAILYLGSSPK